MYSPLIVDRNLHALSHSGLQIQRRSITDSVSISTALTDLFDEKGEPKRPFTTDESNFIKSEIILCRLDFRYFAERYGYTELDASEGGGIAPPKFWPSQERALQQIADREEDNHRELEKYGFNAGIRGVWHKTRQQGATALLRLISGHRMILYRRTRCIAASLDEDKVHELYTRDKVLLDNLPFFLKPELEFDVKDSHLGLAMKSRLVYQQANQKSGVGTGQQFDVSHMTEVALWPWAERLQFDFLPAVPQAITTFVGFESTANGRGNFWHEFTESIRHKVYGFGSWIYSFTPWYINSTKNRLAAPDEWRPNVITLEHAALIERSSAEFAGSTVFPNRNQLYWWETEYELNRKLGTLHIFLTNYPATPEQSFQHSAQSALPLETLEWMRTNADITRSMPYHLDYAQRA